MKLFTVFLILLYGEYADGEETVVLPCHIDALPDVNPTVIWSRKDLKPQTIHLRREKDDLRGQNEDFIGRTSMKSDALDSGDFSLTLTKPDFSDSGIYTCSISNGREELRLMDVQLEVKERDSGVYICTFYRKSGIVRQKVILHLVKEIFPTWARIFLVLLVLLLVSGGLLFHFRHYFISVYRVEVDSGEESVLLPFKTAARLPKEVRVTWRHNTGRMVHACYRKVFMCSVDFKSWSVQHDQYKNRTKIVKEDKFGDFSLILKNPTKRDTGTYSCTVYKYGSEIILTMKHVLLDVKAGPDSLIIAIDFGSGFSGYAFNVKPRQEGGETQIKRWSNGLGLDTPKTPTCILFDEHGEFMKFGYEAKTTFNNMRGEETKKHYFFENFKRNVLNTDDWRERIDTDNRKSMSTLKVFTEVLRFLKDDALKTIRSQPEGGKFTADNFTWVLTVPDILKDSTKELIIKSATQAGLVTDNTKDKLMFVLESEAALTWCLKLQSEGFITQNHSRDSQDQSAGAAEPDTSCNEPTETKVLLETQRDRKRYLVVDCGDKNIHFTVHEVLEGGAMKKLHWAFGEDLGGKQVDIKFKLFLEKIFSDGIWNKYKENFPNEVQKMMYDFTHLKHLDEDILICCSLNLGMLAQKHKEIEMFFDSVEGASWDEGSIRISREILRSFYDESLQEITKKLREILDKDLNIGYIVLVGGLAMSQIVRQHITDQFGRRYKVLCPLRPQEAILKGAVELGRNPKLVAFQRKCPAWFKCLS
ncbi:heat shock 70 kDa protein 12A-like isoform X2 [Xiphophorus maculatus]|uniref:heat shock 70 kDa protein 12A-like isoform X2 n=1 Tax=Xiphophorus maculatus TaxID=8083 RepID=UPI000C6CAE03|nr:heat shock 70 kDa protein 12A-like isoform X2 [Xiphophorus maculatus]